MKVTCLFFLALCALFCLGCGNGKAYNKSIELITEDEKQIFIFKNLMTVTNNTIQFNNQEDSLAFLILPVQASCPSCRKKTIDSIMKHSEALAKSHFIVISAKGGRKLINSFFLEQQYDLPNIESRLFIDSTNQAYKFDLYKDKPTMYYSYKKKVYKKVAAIPATVRQDLQEFFSGYRIN